MNSHVSQKLGVAYKANLKYTVQIVLFIVFSGIFNMTYSAPMLPNDFAFHESRNNSYIQLPHETKPTNSYLYLHANNNMWLEILPNGDVKSNTCPTRYGAIESGSHSTSHMQGDGNMDDAKKVAKSAGVYLKGVVSKRFLCVNKTGHIYSLEDYNETDCAFIQRPKFEINNSVVHYFKHLNHVNLYRSRKQTKKFKKVRLQLGLRENGTVFAVMHHSERKEKHKPMLSINKVHIPIENLETYKDTCANKPKVQRPKRRFKFCRKVWKRFFSASIKDLRRFRKYNCWDKLREMRNKKRRNRQNT